MAFDPTALSIGVPLVLTYDNGEPGGQAVLAAGNVDGTLKLSAEITLDPTNLATSARQDTGNTSLAAISGKLPATLGTKTAATSLSVALSTEAAVLQAAQATSAKQDDQTTAIGLLATQATLASILTELQAQTVLLTTIATNTTPIPP